MSWHRRGTIEKKEKEKKKKRKTRTPSDLPPFFTHSKSNTKSWGAHFTQQRIKWNEKKKQTQQMNTSMHIMDSSTATLCGVRTHSHTKHSIANNMTIFLTYIFVFTYWIPQLYCRQWIYFAFPVSTCCDHNRYTMYWKSQKEKTRKEKNAHNKLLGLFTSRFSTSNRCTFSLSIPHVMPIICDSIYHLLFIIIIFIFQFNDVAWLSLVFHGTHFPRCVRRRLRTLTDCVVVSK